MNLQFQPASDVDIAVIYAQAQQLIDTYEEIDRIDYPKVLAWMRQKIESNICCYTRVMIDGTPCGYYRLCDDGELDDFYILPEYQNRGIGAAVLEKCIAQSPVTIYLYVFSRNLRAISFYQRFGFTLRQTIGKTRWIMERKG